MKVKIQWEESMTAKLSADGKTLVIEIEIDKAGAPSASGKTRVHASTHGNVQAGIQINGKPLVIGLNAYTSAR